MRASRVNWLSAFLLIGVSVSAMGRHARGLTGLWYAHLEIDSGRLLREAKSSEHRKLLEYAIARLKKANISLLLDPKGAFHFTFDDGYRPDRMDASGGWSLDGDEVILTQQGLRSTKDYLRIEAGGTRLIGALIRKDLIRAVYTHAS